MKISRIKEELRSWWHSSQELSEKRELAQKENFLRNRAARKVTIEFNTSRTTAYIMVGKLPILEMPGTETIENLLLAKQRQEDILMDYWTK